MSDNATDRLRKMLDERGVEWNDGGEGLTIIPVQYGVPRAWTVNTWPSGKDMGDCLWVQNRHPLTPEQVIAATVGAEDTYTREECEASFVRGYSLGSLPVGSDPQWDENRQTVDEHMAELGWVRKDAATLGRGTCHDTGESRLFRCSECGFGVEDIFINDERKYLDTFPRYCPHCGKRAKEAGA